MNVSENDVAPLLRLCHCLIYSQSCSDVQQQDLDRYISETKQAQPYQEHLIQTWFSCGRQRMPRGRAGGSESEVNMGKGTVNGRVVKSRVLLESTSAKPLVPHRSIRGMGSQPRSLNNFVCKVSGQFGLEHQLRSSSHQLYSPMSSCIHV